MNVIPTLEGGLSIEPENAADWMVLEAISTDIGRPSHLAESLAGLMGDDSEWEELVVPDLEQNFNVQCRYVQEAVESAREQNSQAIFIKAHNADKWYGALNQARMSLQARYDIHGLDNFEDAPEELRSAHFRDRFYLTLQGVLLEYVMGNS